MPGTETVLFKQMAREQQGQGLCEALSTHFIRDFHIRSRADPGVFPRFPETGQITSG